MSTTACGQLLVAAAVIGLPSAAWAIDSDKSPATFNAELSPFFNVAKNCIGIQIAGLWNQCIDDLLGISVAVLNIATHRFIGIQLGGVNLSWEITTLNLRRPQATIAGSPYEKWSVARGYAMFLNQVSTGAQVGAFSNFAVDLRGIQVAGIFNISRSLRGMQLAVVNGVTGRTHAGQADEILDSEWDVIGFQGGALINAVEGRMLGAQVGPVNVAATVWGLQAGVVNVTYQSFNGLQLGLVNIAHKSFKGLQIGAVNVATHNRIPFLPGLLFSF